MNRGLIAKIARETGPMTAAFAVGLLGVQAALTQILPTIHEQLAGQLMQIGFIRNLIQALVGADLGDNLSVAVFSAIAWVHPVVLAVVWGHAIVFCTRTPCGEVDRGTIDFLLGLPLSRSQIYLTESAACLLSGVVVLATGLAGHVASIRLGSSEIQLPGPSLAAVNANLLCLYWAVAGTAFLVSSISERRGRAVAMVFALVVASLLLNFLAQFWEPARRLSFLSLLHYYRPFFIARGTAWPLADMAVLAGVGCAAWAIGWGMFARRDICTV